MNESSNARSAACARCGCPEADHPGFLAIGPCDEYRADHPAAQGRLLPSECPNCGRMHNGHDFDADPGPVQVQRDRYREALEAIYKVGRGHHVEVAREALNDIR